MRQSEMRTITTAMAIYLPSSLSCESVAAKRERDTWLGLITMPLSGWEIPWPYDVTGSLAILL
jgi:hypothetical protein